MIRHGEPPYLECSSRGDKRFSAYYARVRRCGNKSIEELYQAAKVFKDGATGLPIDEARGLRPVNPVEVAQLYSALWDQYMLENTHLVKVLMQATGLSDVFGKPGHCCQATELWRIRETWRVHLTAIPKLVITEDGKLFKDGKLVLDSITLDN